MDKRGRGRLGESFPCRRCSLAEDLIRVNPDLILVSDEVGYGVVPIDAFDRAYREVVGRICTKLAAYSHRVTRVACGIGTVIKE